MFCVLTVLIGISVVSIQGAISNSSQWAAAFGFSMALAYISDKTQMRFPFYAFGLCVALGGNIILYVVHDNRFAEYGGVFLYLMGVVGAMPIGVCWFAMNLKGHRNRVIGIPWQIGISNVAGIISTFAFPTSDAPQYHLGYSLGLAFLCVGGAAALAYCLGCLLENKNRTASNRLVL